MSIMTYLTQLSVYLVLKKKKKWLEHGLEGNIQSKLIFFFFLNFWINLFEDID